VAVIAFVVASIVASTTGLSPAKLNLVISLAELFVATGGVVGVLGAGSSFLQATAIIIIAKYNTAKILVRFFTIKFVFQILKKTYFFSPNKFCQKILNKKSPIMGR
jgi:hypothetical protein